MAVSSYVITSNNFVLDRNDWLDQHKEDTLEPDIAIIDPHIHLYDEPGNYHYLYEEARKDLACGHNVVATVFVECRSFYRADGPEEMKPVGETEFANGIAAMAASGRYGKTKLNAAIIGKASLLLGPAVERVLEAHMLAAPDRFRGIRHSAGFVQGVDNPLQKPGHKNFAGMMADRRYREGLSRIRPLGLIFEGGCHFTQLLEFRDLARAFPDTTMVLNHYGTPAPNGPYAGKRAEVIAAWKPAIREVGKCENVIIKMGGVGIYSFDYRFHERPLPPTSEDVANAMREITETCIEAFGPDRCMFESNFPVDRGAFSYHTYWNAAKRLAAGYSASEKDAMMGGTAKRVYSIKL